jgi:hypothetical protein
MAHVFLRRGEFKGTSYKQTLEAAQTLDQWRSRTRQYGLPGNVEAGGGLLTFLSFTVAALRFAVMFTWQFSRPSTPQLFLGRPAHAVQEHALHASPKRRSLLPCPSQRLGSPSLKSPRGKPPHSAPPVLSQLTETQESESRKRHPIYSIDALLGDVSEDTAISCLFRCFHASLAGFCGQLRWSR